ncbi:hypothetical protein KR026_005048 [Drosophila bipectinata]|nr:hypothetical protein KR026_005048 [Drosophila bipectinata]
MFPDEFDNQPFDPFNVGPPNSGLRLDYDIPTCCSYPPPVFVAKPEYVKAAREQKALLAGSQASLSRSSKLKADPSQIGEVAISKAINEEMTLAKKQAAAIHENARINAGRESKVNVSQDEAVSVKDSVRTLLPVKSKRQTSGEGEVQSSESDSSVGSKVSQISYKASRISQAGSATASSTTLIPKSILKNPISFKDAVRSTISMKSKVSATDHLKPRASERSTRSHTSQKNVEATASNATIKNSIVSLRKDKETASKASIKSKTSEATSRIGLKENFNKLTQNSESSIGKSLTEQVADLADRLNAGNEPNFRRYDSVLRNHSISEPKKLNHGDRMTFWFSDAVLS